MKKIVLLLMVLVIGTAVFAATAKPAPVAQTKLAPVPPAASVQSGMAGKIAIGDWGGWNTLSYGINADIVGSIGSYYLSTGSCYGLLLKADYLLTKINDVQPCVGVYYNTLSTGASGSAGIYYGLSAAIATNLLVGADMILVDYTKAGATTTTSIIPNAVMKATFVL